MLKIPNRFFVWGDPAYCQIKNFHWLSLISEAEAVIIVETDYNKTWPDWPLTCCISPTIWHARRNLQVDNLPQILQSLTKFQTRLVKLTDSLLPVYA